jgi:hypothetical protein
LLLPLTGDYTPECPKTRSHWAQMPGDAHYVAIVALRGRLMMRVVSADLGRWQLGQQRRGGITTSKMRIGSPAGNWGARAFGSKSHRFSTSRTTIGELASGTGAWKET